MDSVKDDPKRAGFPHSEILGSKLARSSPKLFAACHVLHRLLAPRHPPDALRCLRDRPRPEQGQGGSEDPPRPAPEHVSAKTTRHRPPSTAILHAAARRPRHEAPGFVAERCRVTASCSRHRAFADAAGRPTHLTARCLIPLHNVEQRRTGDERRPVSTRSPGYLVTAQRV